MDKVTVPNYVYNELSSARDSGLVNMFSIKEVCQLVSSKTEEWINEDKNRYGECIMYGIKTTEKV
tara:strand:+ start:32 stop:226 length:195 start_codon:yes stop_codon:yes gene_type:complete